MTRWRLLVYAVLTRAIALLGALRERLARGQPSKSRPDRVLPVYDGGRLVCPDCALAQDQTPTGPGCSIHPGPEVGHVWPIRPSGYRYRRAP